MRTQVVIVGGGPSGLLLGQLLHRKGIDTVILERKTREYVLGRIRAGILETGLVDMMREAGVAERMDRECFIHHGTCIAYENEMFDINFQELIGQNVIVYGQTEVTRDLYDARDASGAQTVFEVEDVEIRDVRHRKALLSPSPSTAVRDGSTATLLPGAMVFMVSAVRRSRTPVRKDYEKVFPFGWLGVLSETPLRCMRN